MPVLKSHQLNDKKMGVRPHAKPYDNDCNYERQRENRKGGVEESKAIRNRIFMIKETLEMMRTVRLQLETTQRQMEKQLAANENGK